MLSKWQGLNIQDVYLDWVEAMQGMTLGAINHAIEMSKSNIHPPSQGEFIAHCRHYVVPVNNLLLVHKSPERNEENLEKIRQMKEILARKMTCV